MRPPGTHRPGPSRSSTSRETPSPSPASRPRMRMLWDDTYLYVAARLEEPHVWATLSRHDDIVYRDNDFEVFVDPEGDGRWYGEVEVNALGTVFDLLLDRPYSEGGRPHANWSPPGLRTAVSVEGTLNDPSDVDRGWTVEIAIPHAALRGPRHCAPAAAPWRRVAHQLLARAVAAPRCGRELRQAARYARGQLGLDAATRGGHAPPARVGLRRIRAKPPMMCNAERIPNEGIASGSHNRLHPPARRLPLQPWPAIASA